MLHQTFSVPKHFFSFVKNEFLKAANANSVI